MLFYNHRRNIMKTQFAIGKVRFGSFGTQWCVIYQKRGPWAGPFKIKKYRQKSDRWTNTMNYTGDLLNIYQPGITSEEKLAYKIPEEVFLKAC